MWIRWFCAINSNYVTVAITAPAEDMLAQEVEVKNGAGVVVPVKPLDIAAGDKTAEFEFVTAVKAADLKGVWTVNDQSYDLDLFNNLSDFLAANDQLKLNAALVALGIENVETANMPAYEIAKGNVTKTAEELTVADVQKLVDDVNAKAISADDEAAIVKAVTDAKTAGNQVALLQALQNEAFVRVNPEWVATATNGYMTKIAGTETKIADIQTVINTSNDAIVNAEIAPIVSTIDRDDLNDAKALIETWATVDKDGKITDDTIKPIVDNKTIEIQLALVDVLEATTPTALKARVTALAELANPKTGAAVVDMKNYIDANGKAYVSAIAAEADKANKLETAAKINTLLTTVNGKEATALVDAVYDAASATTVDADALLKALNDLGLKQVADSNKEVYKADAADFKTESTTTTNSGTKVKADVQAQVDKSNVKAVTTATDADKLLEALKVLELDNIVDANKDAYLADVTGGSATIKTDAATIDAALKVINDAVVEAAKVKAINEATSATAVKAALDELAITSYVNVPSVDKLYIAEQVFAAVEAAQKAGNNTLYADKAAVTTALDTATTGIIAEYEALIAEFAKTELTDTATTVTQLGLLGYDAFDNLTAGEKANVAEAFVANYPMDDATPPAAIDYETLAAVKTAVDAAIAAIK
jgi:hypothetical protein